MADIVTLKLPRLDVETICSLLIDERLFDADVLRNEIEYQMSHQETKDKRQ